MSDHNESRLTGVAASPVIGRRTLLKVAGALGATGVAAANGAAEGSGSFVGEEPKLVPADAEAGFNYPYFLYAPATDRTSPPMLVQPNNTGTSSDDFDVHRGAAERRADNGLARRLSDDLEVPLLVPVFPRPRSDPVDWTHYVHALDAETMAIDDGPLERVDEQLLAMVDDARERLADEGYGVREKVMLDGFSAAGTFVNRFAALHPDRVVSVSAGGINGTAILPTAEANGRELPYPIGVADLEELTGEAFDREAWRAVDRLVYLGGEDDNDTIPYDDAWSDRHREIALDVYGEDMQEDRMPYCREVYEDAGARGRLEVYPGVGHRWTPGIVAEIRRLHRKHLDEFFAEFDPLPGAGNDAVRVVAGTDGDADADAFDIRVFNADGTELTTAPTTVDAGDGAARELELDREPEPGERLTAAVLPADETDLDRAVATAAESVVARASFTTRPEGGDGAVDVAYALDDGYDVREVVRVWVETEQGGAATVATLGPDDDGEATVDLPRDENGVLLEQDREVSVRVVDGDFVDGTALAAETVTVAEPDGIAVDVDVTVDPVIRRGTEATATVAVRGLGGGTDELPVSITVDGESAAEASVAVAPSETDTVTVTVPTDDDVGNPVTIAATAAGTTAAESTVVAERPATGIGTAADPYEVSDAAELAYAAISPDAVFELVSGLDLSGFDRFPRIGSLSEPFSGVLDGNGHAIYDLRIESDVDQFEGAGLIGNLEDGTVTDLHLVDVEVVGGDFTGAVVGMGSARGEVSRVTVSGTVVGESNVGGVVGGTSTGRADSADVAISEVASHVDVSGRSKVAGILGQASGDPVSECYADGQVAGDGGVAGIVGWADFGTTVADCYVTAELEGDGGAVVARVPDADVDGVYWDREAAGTTDSAGGGEPLAREEMTGDDAREHMSNLDFDDTWETVPGEPPELRRASHPDRPHIAVDVTEPAAGDLVATDENLAVVVVVRNAGTEAGSTTVALHEPVDAETDVSLDPGEEERVAFEVPADIVGDGVAVVVKTDHHRDRIELSVADDGDADADDEDADADDEDADADGGDADADGGDADADDEDAGDTAESDGGTESRTPDATDDAMPGPGVTGTLTALGGAGYLLRRRLGGVDGDREGDDS